eukprot:6111904-Pleurochrysis_carterae.AAC.3
MCAHACSFVDSNAIILCAQRLQSAPLARTARTRKAVMILAQASTQSRSHAVTQPRGCAVAQCHRTTPLTASGPRTHARV